MQTYNRVISCNSTLSRRKPKTMQECEEESLIIDRGGFFSICGADSYWLSNSSLMYAADWPLEELSNRADTKDTFACPVAETRRGNRIVTSHPNRVGLSNVQSQRFELE